jgi:ABC-type glutathione transport system ATPase component
MNKPLLEVAISVSYPAKPGALRDVRFRVAEGEILGLIGQSGSGKSTIAFAIPRLLVLRGGVVGGSIRFRGADLMAAGERELRRLRGREISIVLQSPMTALNPALRLETQLREVWRAHRKESWKLGREAAHELFASMGLPPEENFLRRYPRELSVGQAQRVVIAMAVLHRPKLLIADELTSALDPATGLEILELFRKCNREFGAAILYVSHDLESVRRLCDRVLVVYEGTIVGEDVPAYPWAGTAISSVTGSGMISPSTPPITPAVCANASGSPVTK